MTRYASRRASPDFVAIMPKSMAPNKNHGVELAKLWKAASNRTTPKAQKRKQPIRPVSAWSKACVIQAMITPRAMAMACWARGSKCNGRNQTISGTITASTRPLTTTDTGGRKSKTAAGARSVIVSVVKESRLPEHVIKSLFSPRVERHQGQPHLRRCQKSQASHHVFERNRIGVEKNRLREREQLEMQPPRFVPSPARCRVAQRGDASRIEIAHRVHHTGRPQGQHRQAE